MKVQKAVLFLFLLFISMNLGAQRNCGSHEHMLQQMEKYPKMQKRMQEIEKATQQFLNNTEKDVSGVITIPVVVHVVYNNASENISDAQINTQIQVLNEDFRRLNSDANNAWPQAADSEIEFCLASIDPQGNSTNGITRTSTSVTAFSANDNMKFNSTGGKDAWPTQNYLNIWVCDLSGGLLGYAQFPGGPSATDGVVTDYQYFGTIGTATAPFDLGRTTTHEVGHWLNLRHIWGDGPCSTDDFVGDTPDSDNPNYGCPLNHVSCSSLDMVANYMDYTDDACMNLYTLGQKNRMRALFDTGGFRESLLSSPACGTSPPPSCNDGIQNGNETGVDCGGPDCSPCGSACQDIEVTMTIVLDDYPAETTWQLTDANGNTVASGGPYGSLPAGTTVTENFCLTTACYDYTISDSYGDGICCAYGNGSYELVDNNGNVLASGGSFGSSETTNFCLGPQPTCDDGIQNGNETGIDCGAPDCPPCGSSCADTEITMTILLDNYPAETTWELVGPTGNTLASGGPYGSLPAGSSVSETFCLADNCYDYTIFDSYGDGICCVYGNGSYQLLDNNGNVLASGGSFGSVETTNFCLGSVPPSCNDGIQNGDETGVDCGGASCPPCNTGCTNQTIDFNDFDSGWGIWNDGGSDCRRSANDSNLAFSAPRPVRLRDNTNSSVMTTDPLNLANAEEVTIEFTYVGSSMENGEDFWLQASVNGGAWQTLISWASGIDFINNQREFESVVITGNFSSNIRFRFRCDASGNNDFVYIDDVEITACINGNTRHVNESIVAEDTVNNLDEKESITELTLYPNPAINQSTLSFISSREQTSRLNVLDMNGQLLQTSSQSVRKGINNIELRWDDFESGLYYIQLINGEQRIVKKLIIMK